MSMCVCVGVHKEETIKNKAKIGTFQIEIIINFFLSNRIVLVEVKIFSLAIGIEF